MNPATVQLSENHFKKISDLVYRTSGISLKTGKESLVRARLMKRLRARGMLNVKDYLDYINSEQGRHELARFIDVMTTNKTSFFREPEHFHYLRDQVLPELSGHRLRFWSAACSSGEEPFTLAMWIREHLPDLDARDVLILKRQKATRSCLLILVCRPYSSRCMK